MASAVISPKFQIVIPKEIRDRAGLAVGQRVQFITRGALITLVPERPIADLRGVAKGMSTDGLRDKTDRLV
jgi:AbrB family looped-hinge helix DNA binding protein